LQLSKAIIIAISILIIVIESIVEVIPHLRLQVGHIVCLPRQLILCIFICVQASIVIWLVVHECCTAVSIGQIHKVDFSVVAEPLKKNIFVVFAIQYLPFLVLVQLSSGFLLTGAS